MPETLGQSLLTSVRGYWKHAQSNQKFLYAIGMRLLLSAAFHGAVFLLKDGSFEGDVSWRKPILFGESFGLTAISIAWVMTFLPKWPIRGWLLAIALGLANVFEVTWVSVQQWRGVPSHFNSRTPFDESLFVLAGLVIMFTAAVICTVTLLTFARLKASPSIALAIRAGMVMLIAGQAFGIPMIAKGGHTFGRAGAMKVPHALALHGAQILPFLAWLLLFTDWSEGRRTKAVLLVAIGYAGLIAVSAFQTFRGHALLDLHPITAVFLVAASMVVLATYVVASRNLQKTR
jgi:hypothetical protein